MKIQTRGTRLLISLLIFALLFPCAGSAEAGATVFTAEEEYTIAAEGERLWIATRENIYRIDGGGEAKPVFRAVNVQAISADGEDLYILHQPDGAEIVQIGPDGETKRAWKPGLNDTHAHSIVALRNSVALLTGHDEDGEIWLMDKETGAIREETSLYPVTSIARNGADSLLANVASYAGLLYSYDAETARAEQITEHKLFAPAIKRDGEGEVYLLEFGALYALQEGGGMRLLHDFYAEIGGAEITSCAIGGDTLYLHMGDETRSYALASLFAPEKTESITVCNAQMLYTSKYFQKALELFSLKHPEVEVRFEEIKNDEMALRLMANEGDVDIFYMLSLSGEQYIASGLTADLNAYPQIPKAMEEWTEIGAIRNRAGKLMCVPVNIESFMLAKDEEANAIVQMDLPEEGWTPEEFEALAKEARSRGAYLVGEDFPGDIAMHIYSALYTDYSQRELSYDTPEFRGIMEWWKRMHNDGLIFVGKFYEPTEELVLLREGTARSLESTKAAYLPSPSGEPLTYAQTHGFYLYEHSRKKELAADFLAALASRETQLADVNTGSYFLRQEPSAYAEYEPDPWFGEVYFPSPENLLRWREILERGVTHYNVVQLREISREWFSQYLSGEIDIDQFASRLQEKADILLYE